MRRLDEWLGEMMEFPRIIGVFIMVLVIGLIGVGIGLDARVSKSEVKLTTQERVLQIVNENEMEKGCSFNSYKRVKFGDLCFELYSDGYVYSVTIERFFGSNTDITNLLTYEIKEEITKIIKEKRKSEMLKQLEEL